MEPRTNISTPTAMEPLTRMLIATITTTETCTQLATLTNTGMRSAAADVASAISNPRVHSPAAAASTMLSSILLFGFVIGMRHAFEADHLAAVSVLVSRQNRGRDML